MKPLYWGIIAVVALIIILVIANKNAKAKADAQIIATNQQVSALNGASQSTVASILGALFPYAQLGVQTATTKG